MPLYQLTLSGFPHKGPIHWKMPCGVCGKLFTAHRYYVSKGRGFHCSYKCAGIARSRKGRKARKSLERQCSICGVTYVTRWPGKYCSKRCRQKNAEETYRKNTVGRKTIESWMERNCKLCDREFSRTDGRQVYCSSKCRQRAKINKPGMCERCGKPFFYTAGCRGRFCSMRCWGGYFSAHHPQQSSPRGKGGKRADLDNLYVRSIWEANWARYLNWLKSIGEILNWEYEAETFEFSDIRKGTRFYTPDFRVTNKDGSIEFHEVKGWMDPRSQTKLKRMTKYHASVKLIVVDQKAYRAVYQKVGRLISNWERSPKKVY